MYLKSKRYISTIKKYIFGYTLNLLFIQMYGQKFPQIILSGNSSCIGLFYNNFVVVSNEMILLWLL